MASLYVREYRDVATSVMAADVPAGAEPAATDQKLTISGSAAASSAFTATTYFVRVHTDVVCHVEFGDSPTATTSSARMAANQTEFFGVKPGHKVSVISGA